MLTISTNRHDRRQAALEVMLNRLNAMFRLLFDGVPRFPLRLVGEDGDEQFVYASAEGPPCERVPSGLYDAHIHTPWGQIFQAKATVEKEDIRLKARGGQLSPAALSWILFEPDVLLGLSAREIKPEAYDFRYDFWTQEDGRWVSVNSKELVARTEFREFEGQAFGRLTVRAWSSAPRPLWFRVASRTLPSQVIALPPVNDLEIIIPPGTFGDAALQVTARSRQPASRDLSAFLACGDARVAGFLLQESEYPFSSEYFFLHLMRAHFGGARARASQPKPLIELAPLLPDSYVAETWKLMSGERVDINEVAALLLAGVKRGVPVWPHSLKQLDNQLEYVWLHPSNGYGEAVRHALLQINPYVLAGSPASVVRFFAFTPAEPLFATPSVHPVPAPQPQSQAGAHPHTASNQPPTPPAAVEVGNKTMTRGLRKTRVGVVVSNKMAKTAVIETVTRVPHRKFRKIVKRSTKFYAHDEENEAQIGDLVRIMETRPLSKLKRWRLVEVLSGPGKSSHDASKGCAAM